MPINPALFSLIRPHYQTLQGYVSAGMESDKSAQMIFMNANENPYELPGLENCNRYPEPQPKHLLAAYADAYQVKPDNVVMTRGADEAIVVLTRLFCEPNQDASLICSPTFGMYGVNANAMPAKTIDVPLKKSNYSWQLDVDGIIDRANAKGSEYNVKLVFLCSPNNPTGNAFPTADIARICRETEGNAVVVLDETYTEFSEQDSFCSKLAEYPNLIILRTLSKSYSMAGMRMGTLISADEDFVALVRSKCLDAYPLPRASIEAAELALSKPVRNIAQTNIDLILQERNRLENALNDNEIVDIVYPSDANFLLIEMPKASQFVAFCRQQGLVLRDFSDKPGTPNCLRISVGTPHQNDQLLKLFAMFGRD